jgi:hypothetical protein
MTLTRRFRLGGIPQREPGPLAEGREALLPRGGGERFFFFLEKAKHHDIFLFGCDHFLFHSYTNGIPLCCQPLASQQLSCLLAAINMVSYR